MCDESVHSENGKEDRLHVLLLWMVYGEFNSVVCEVSVSFILFGFECWRGKQVYGDLRSLGMLYRCGSMVAGGWWSKLS